MLQLIFLKLLLYLFSYPVPPNIAGTDEPQDVTVLRNRQVTLECKSDAVPPPVITWLKNGERLQVNFLISSTNSFLRLKNKKSALGALLGTQNQVTSGY